MNKLYYGDNLQILREHIKDDSVDLIYLDPPFNSKANYNVLFRSPTGQQSHAQIEAFEDTWHWTSEAEAAFDDVIRSGNTDASELLRAMRTFLKENDMMAYLTMMAVRLLELHRALKPSGSLYLHCDPTASHYLKLLLDAIFGASRFRSEVVWRRTASHSAAKRWGGVHDIVLFYSKSDSYTWNDVLIQHSDDYVARYKQEDERGIWTDDNMTAPGVRGGDSGAVWRGYDVTSRGLHWKVSAQEVAALVGIDRAKEMTTTEKLDALDANAMILWPKRGIGEGGGFPRFKRYISQGSKIQDIITDIPPINSQAQERLGYPTQKPIALLERILAASSNEGEVVLDPFCGCGTTIHAAQKLGRQWIGIDITNLAISLIEKRLTDAFPEVNFDVHGTPKDLDDAHALARRDKYQFQWWAVSLVKAVPFGGKKKGADSGIDGLIYFKPDARTTEKAIVSVKGGENVSVAMVRELAHVVKREQAQLGILITLFEPTRPMLIEAVKEGFYEPMYGGKFARIQILTIEELFNGKQVQIPWIDSEAFRRAAKENVEGDRQKPLF